jgi:predicted cation transporter
MIAGLITILALIFVIPFTIHKVEKHLEYFLFIMGLIAAIISKSLTIELLEEIIQNRLLYFITAAVLLAGLAFRYTSHKLTLGVQALNRKIPPFLFTFIIIVVLGLISSLITAIIASLILVEIILALPYDRKIKINLNIIGCFSIGLGAALTPIGEPLATIVVSKMNGNFLYLFDAIGIYVIPGLIALGILGGFYISKRLKKLSMLSEDNSTDATELERDSIKAIIIRAMNIFIFVIALELLGAGFKPLVETYIINLPAKFLYWINMVSAVLDNATLAAAEISTSMSAAQIEAILMGLLISGGMLIPGNIPNIISAGKLNIKSREWAKTGVPLGLALMLIYFVMILLIK